MSSNNEITLKLKLINIPEHILNKIADGFKWVEDVLDKPNIVISNFFDGDSAVIPTKSACEHALAALKRQAARKPGPAPAPAFDFSSLIGLCDRKTDDIELQGRLNADRIGLALSGLSAFGIGLTPTDADVAKYRDALRRYSATLDELNTKNNKLH